MSMIVSGRGKKKTPAWLRWAIMGATMVFLLPFYYFDRMDLARPFLFATAAIGLAVATRWKLRVYRWFWVSIGLIAVMHAYAILRMDWDERYMPSFVVVTIGLVDYGVVLALIWFMERICKDADELPKA
jgi:hypothetical protein